MNLQYPVGPYQKIENLSIELVKEWGKELGNFPRLVEATISGFTEDMLLTKTLPGNWTVAQVIHHLSDSHAQSLFRMKLTLSEDCPTVRPYNETEFGKLKDAHLVDLEPALAILRGVHAKMEILANSLIPEDLQREYYHPENKAKSNLGNLFSLYTWHGKHHLEHIKLLKSSKGWK